MAVISTTGSPVVLLAHAWVHEFSPRFGEYALENPGVEILEKPLVLAADAERDIHILPPHNHAIAYLLRPTQKHEDHVTGNVVAETLLSGRCIGYDFGKQVGLKHLVLQIVLHQHVLNGIHTRVLELHLTKFVTETVEADQSS